LQGFLREALSNEHPYHDRYLMGISTKPSQNLAAEGAIAIRDIGRDHS
jgi:hypothetical protein